MRVVTSSQSLPRRTLLLKLRNAHNCAIYISLLLTYTTPAAWGCASLPTHNRCRGRCCSSFCTQGAHGVSACGRRSDQQGAGLCRCMCVSASVQKWDYGASFRCWAQIRPTTCIIVTCVCVYVCVCECECVSAWISSVKELWSYVCVCFCLDK